MSEPNDAPPDPLDTAAEILNWTGEPGCYSCDVHGPSCLWHGVPDLVRQRLPRPTE